MTCETTADGRGLASHLWLALRLGGTPLGTDGASDTVQVLVWYIRQLPMILNRFPAWRNDQRTTEGVKPDSYWPAKLTKFVHRAEVLGLESPEGRQAVFELTATTIGWCASILRLYGPPASMGSVVTADRQPQLNK